MRLSVMRFRFGSGRWCGGRSVRPRITALAIPGLLSLALALSMAAATLAGGPVVGAVAPAAEVVEAVGRRTRSSEPGGPTPSRSARTSSAGSLPSPRTSSSRSSRWS